MTEIERLVELATYLGAALVVALALGLVMGWTACSREPGPRGLGWAALALLAAAFGAGAAVSAVGAAPGRWSLWLDGGLMMLAAYLAGCGCACLLRRRARGRIRPTATLG